MKVHKAMAKDVESITPSTTIEEAARRMRARGIGYFPVCERGRLLGVVTDRDITCRAVAEARDPKLATAGDVMSKAVAYCFDDEDLGQAVQLMEQNRVRRLPVLDRREHLVGIVSLSDIARHAPHRLTAEILQAVSRESPLGVTIDPAANIRD